MLKSFLSIGSSPTNFSRYLISKEVDFVKKHCGQYPVVYLDLKDCKGDTWEEMYQEIWLCIRKMVARHKNELAVALSVQNDPIALALSAPYAPTNTTFVSSTLDWLITSVFEHHNKHVIVLIDEYDSPLNCAFRSPNNFYDKASKFFGKFYSSALKGNSALKKACLMGIVEVRGAGILSGLNNIKVFSVSHERYSSIFGFLESEVSSLLGGNITQLEQVREWYNGYYIGSNMVINPWSLMNYISDGIFTDYWVNSAYLDTISTILSPHVKKILAPIFAILSEEGKKLEISPLKTQVNYSNTDWDTTSILHFLVHTGYLTYNVEQNKTFASIPNKEVYTHWEKEVNELVKVAFEPQFQRRLQESLQDLNTAEIESLMKEMLLYCSFHDVYKQYENAYHMFYFGCFFIILHDGNNVIVSSNKEAGHGRYDVRIEFRDLKRVIVFEFKKSSSDRYLDKDADTGLVQAEGNKYVSDMRGCKCLLIGVSFNKKAMSSLKIKLI